MIWIITEKDPNKFKKEQNCFQRWTSKQILSRNPNKYTVMMIGIRVGRPKLKYRQTIKAISNLSNSDITGSRYNTRTNTRGRIMSAIYAKLHNDVLNRPGQRSFPRYIFIL